MSISITSAQALPHQLPNGTTQIAISFSGKSLNDNTSVIVDFGISPFPELGFGGNDKVNSPYVFNNQWQEFSKTVNVDNKTNGPSGNWKPGLIALTATQHDTGDTDGAYAAIVYEI